MSSTYNLHVNIAPVLPKPERLVAKAVVRGNGECITLEISAINADDNVNLFLWGTGKDKWTMLDAIIDACVEGKRTLTALTLAGVDVTATDAR